MITLDGQNYDVRIVYGSLSRTFEILEGSNAGTSLNSTRIRDIHGTRISYSMEIEPNPSNVEDYDAFYEIISSPTDSHSVSFPYGQTQLTFDAMITGGADTYEGKIAGKQRFKTLSLSFVPLEPQRV